MVDDLTTDDSITDQPARLPILPIRTLVSRAGTGGRLHSHFTIDAAHSTQHTANNKQILRYLARSNAVVRQLI